MGVKRQVSLVWGREQQVSTINVGTQWGDSACVRGIDTKNSSRVGTNLILSRRWKYLRIEYLHNNEREINRLKLKKAKKHFHAPHLFYNADVETQKINSLIHLTPKICTNINLTCISCRSIAQAVNLKASFLGTIGNLSLSLIFLPKVQGTNCYPLYAVAYSYISC